MYPIACILHSNNGNKNIELVMMIIYHFDHLHLNGPVEHTDPYIAKEMKKATENLIKF